jgi:hypothetical protein
MGGNMKPCNHPNLEQLLGENVETMTPYQYTIVIIVPLSVAH